MLRHGFVRLRLTTLPTPKPREAQGREAQEAQGQSLIVNFMSKN